MAAAKRKSIAKLCLALGLFVLAGFFRQADRVGAPLPSAAFFLLTNLIYIGLAMGWGFSLESGPAGTSVRLDIPADPLPSTGHASLRSASRSLAVRSRQADRLRTAQSCLAL
mgnify:CR=1 FL=1